MTNSEKALEFIKDGSTIGLGSGHAAERFIRGLGERVRAGLRVRGVATSRASAALAASVGIPLVALDGVMPLDITVDGADEVDPQLNLIKGYGRALVREKIVAAASQRLIILIGPEHVREKTVGVLGSRGKLPVEVVPFGMSFCQQRIEQLGHTAEPLRDAGQLFVTDNGNHILECAVPPIKDAPGLEEALRKIPGVVATGLFIGMADMILIEDQGTVTVRSRPGKRAL